MILFLFFLTTHEGQPQQHPHLHGPQLVLLRQLLEVLVVRFRGLHAHVAQHRPAAQLQVFGVLLVRAELLISLAMALVFDDITYVVSKIKYNSSKLLVI